MFTEDTLEKFVEAMLRGAADQLSSVTVPELLSTVRSQLERIQFLFGIPWTEPMPEMAEIETQFLSIKSVFKVTDAEMFDDPSTRTFRRAAKHFAERVLGKANGPA